MTNILAICAIIAVLTIIVLGACYWEARLRARMTPEQLKEFEDGINRQY